MAPTRPPQRDPSELPLEVEQPFEPDEEGGEPGSDPAQSSGVLARRPTESLTGLALAGAVYGFCTQAGLPNGWAAGIAIVVAFGPMLVSATVDAIRGD